MAAVDRVDPLPGLVGFPAALRAAGVDCSAQRVRAYLDAIGHLDIAEVDQLYWAGRLTLCAEPDDLPRYHDAFAAWFGLSPPPAAARRMPAARTRARNATRLTAALPGDGETGAHDAGPLRMAASDTELLRHRDLAELTAAERAQLRELFTTLRLDPPTRPGMRFRPRRAGVLDPHRMVRVMRAAGGEPIRLVRKDKARRARRVVLLVDVSGSMAPYADALLRFAHAMCRRAPASTEVFTVGTRLTRVSRQLRARDPEHALTAAGRAVPDFAGGTRLGETLRAFLDRWGQRGMARRAVVVLFSDGWERGDPGLLAGQLARLRRLAHAVLWVCPHAGRDGYAPVQSGIAAALPYLDRLLAGHSLATLQELLAEVRDA